MVSRVSLERRLGRLGTPETMHFVFLEDGETADQAIQRYQHEREKVIATDDLVHFVSFVDSHE